MTTDKQQKFHKPGYGGEDAARRVREAMVKAELEKRDRLRKFYGV